MKEIEEIVLRKSIPLLEQILRVNKIEIDPDEEVEQKRGQRASKTERLDKYKELLMSLGMYQFLYYYDGYTHHIEIEHIQCFLQGVKFSRGGK